jgi:hypothetical protein
VVCVGNGLVDEEPLTPYRELAELLGGKLGCTRPIVDRGSMPYKLQIGQSGVIIEYELYLAFGVFGAVDHVAGVTADCFVSVNSDPNASAFRLRRRGRHGRSVPANDSNRQRCVTLCAGLRHAVFQFLCTPSTTGGAILS